MEDGGWDGYRVSWIGVKVLEHCWQVQYDLYQD